MSDDCTVVTNNDPTNVITVTETETVLEKSDSTDIVTITETETIVVKEDPIKIITEIPNHSHAELTGTIYLNKNLTGIIPVRSDQILLLREAVELNGDVNISVEDGGEALLL